MWDCGTKTCRAVTEFYSCLVSTLASGSNFERGRELSGPRPRLIVSVSVGSNAVVWHIARNAIVCHEALHALLRACDFMSVVFLPCVHPMRVIAVEFTLIIWT